MVPKVTNPLTKAIRTLEGVAVVVSDVVLGVAAAVDPSKLSPKEAVIVVGAQHVALLVSRTVLKLRALNAPEVVSAAERFISDAMAAPDVEGA